MKRINILLMNCALFLGITSCSLDSEVYQYKDSDAAFTTLKDVANGMNGAYYALGSYRFLGNYAVAFGDMSAGICKGSASSGHFYSVSNYTISDTDAEIEDAWQYGYQVIDRTTRTIIGAKNMESTLSEADKATADNYIGQCYALRALANYYLVNLYSLPYSAGTDNPGIVLVVDKPIEAFETITRNTVGETYAQILDDIATAETLLKATDDPGIFYMNVGAVEALKTRVYLSMGDYDKAKTAALAAIQWCGSGDGTGDDTSLSNTDYLAMWGSISEEKNEEIFSIKKSADDNLSANALNTLYGSYYGTVTNSMRTYFDETDIRMGLMAFSSQAGGYQPLKYPGITGAAAVSNIRIFRKSEMSLALAEIYARQNDIANAQKYLMYTAKRNSVYADGSKVLPATKETLLGFISEERIREFFAEGHAFYDARRMGDLVNSDSYQNFDIQKFVFPIPASEINSGSGVVQNTDWFKNLPK